jgi:hypothetical protein
MLGSRVKITLNENGRDKVRKLIKEERRKNIEWLIKVIGPILTITVSIWGLLLHWSLSVKSNQQHENRTLPEPG